jgi:uncharacterized protein (TIGR03086 family)
MSEVNDRYASVADGFTVRVGALGPEDWSKPTPCSDWTVADLVAHLIATHRRVTANVEGRQAVEPDREAPLLPQWLAATAEVRAALADERAAVTVSGMFGEQTFESLVGRLLCTDTLVHTWDLARATRQDERLDEAALSQAFDFLAPLDDAIRRPGGFAEKITPPAGADLQTRFLNFCGRAP